MTGGGGRVVMVSSWSGREDEAGGSSFRLEVGFKMMMMIASPMVLVSNKKKRQGRKLKTKEC